MMADEESGSGRKEGGRRARGRWWPAKWKIARSLGLGGSEERNFDEAVPVSELEHDRGRGQSNVRRGKNIAKRDL